MLVTIIAYLAHLAGMLIGKFGFFLQKHLFLQLEAEDAQKKEEKDDQKSKKPIYCYF